MKTLPKSYEHKEREAHWQKHWVESGTYNFKNDQPREQTFVIDTPPPTVSGILHMGHIFSYTQADFIARYQRMSGKDVFYPMGFDDNGLPTERLVEKTLGIKGSNMPRAEFIEKCKIVVKEAEDEFRRLFKSAALSVDWNQEYQTINDDVCTLSQASFIDLMKKGEAYRDFRPTYWDWVDQTAIAQAEIENKEMPGVMNEIEFTLEDGSPLVIMTTRPELLGACVAVMYHPEDANAAKYKGKTATTPLFGVKVPMIADEAVEREKGTGIVMCCTFGDDTDKEWARQYKLKIRPILQKDGKCRVFYVPHPSSDEIIGIQFILDIGDEYLPKAASGMTMTLSDTEINAENCISVERAITAFQAIEGLKPKQANAKIIELLQAEGKLLKQTPMTHTVKCAERSGTPIEIIPTHQWFIRIVDKKEALLAKGEQCNWNPEYMRIRLNQWIEGLKEDWCISRQRFFGIPFPVWYSKRAGEEGKVLFADFDQLPIDPQIGLPKGYSREEVTADMDVMDTWATSSISPQLSAKGICKDFAIDKTRYQKLFPADLRPQAHEIIRTWAFYTIVKAHLHENTIPWKNLMISGWCLAADKTKMSKSKGNVVTPVALIEEKGTDAVRYWASTSRLGADTAFSEDLLKIGRKLVNKIWNASQFAAINLNKIAGTPTTASADVKSGKITEALDLWILSRLQKTVAKATEQFEALEYCDARVAIEDFFWNDFCDNYLELVKTRAYDDASAGQQSALYALYHCLDAILRLFAPFVPHITEELYSHIFDEKYAASGSLHARGQWPRTVDYPVNDEAELSGMAAVDVLNIIRKAKSEAGVSIKFPVLKVEVLVKSADVSWAHLARVLDDVKSAGTADTIIEGAGETYVSDKGWFAVNVTLAKVEEQRRNPDQKENEKLDGKNIVHGPGSPDLSKHVVKVQVNSLPDSLQRQK
ncbi:MAG: valine--tRNA ligase [Alphaproteobacteria bacterium]|nr:valine--tRNA ligase [Alphaproteobacteria bacterium]